MLLQQRRDRGGRPHRAAVRSGLPLRRARWILALALAVVGLAAYNWWLPSLVVPGIRHTPNAFFSDFSANGEPHARALQSLDLLSGVLLIFSLLLTRTRRPEWCWLLVWAVAEAVGGRYPYACEADLSESCRRLERRLQLPAHHYVHMVAGTVEFAAATIAIWRARHRPDDDTAPGPLADLANRLWKILLVAYPALGLAFLTDRLGLFMEPIFFVSFSAMALAYIRSTAPAAPGPQATGAMRPASTAET